MAKGYLTDKPPEIAGAICGTVRTSAAFARIDSREAARVAQ
jgi:hypothetical protein